MTLYLNLRAGAYGSVCSPYLLEGDATAGDATVTALNAHALPLIAKGKTVLLAAHGFNVSYVSGLRSLGHLEQALEMRDNELFIGVLWPGDWVVPAINYPFEDGVADHCGALMGDFCNQWLGSASSLSFLSHSLGARVILGAIRRLKRQARSACITAGAVNSGALAEEFATAALNCAAIRTLSSRQDLVLRFAYPPGDLLADLLDPDHPPNEEALGRGGPRIPFGASIVAAETHPTPAFNHGNYFPPAIAPLPAPSDGDLWRLAVAFMASVFRGRTPVWP